MQRDGLSRVLPAHIAMVALDEGADADEHVPTSLLDRMAFLIDLTKVSLRDIDYDDWSGATPARPLSWRAKARHPRLCLVQHRKAWMAGLARHDGTVGAFARRDGWGRCRPPGNGHR